MSKAMPLPVAFFLAFTLTTVAADEDVIEAEAFHLDGSELVDSNQGARISIPSDWLDTRVGESGSYVQFAGFDPQVNSFAISEGLIGIHLSSYGIQRQGSAGAAAGRDVFVAIDPHEREVLGHIEDLGVTKSRGGRYMGCHPAHNDHFYLADINGDGSIDIGAMRESFTCEDAYDPVKDVDRVVAAHSWHEFKWYIFDDGSWTYDAAQDGECPPDDATYAPWPGLAKGPVQFVMEMSRSPVNMMTTSSCELD